MIGATVAHAAQRRAIAPGVSAWVSASAGTGKTKVLTDRLLGLMLEGSDPARRWPTGSTSGSPSG